MAYTRADLNWNDKKSRSTMEMNDPASRPALADQDAHVENYDKIFLGFPIWWYVAAAPSSTPFWRAMTFPARASIPFATSGGSGIEKAVKSLTAHCPAAAWKPGKLLNHTDVASWAKTIVNKE